MLRTSFSEPCSLNAGSWYSSMPTSSARSPRASAGAWAGACVCPPAGSCGGACVWSPPGCCAAGACVWSPPGCCAGACAWLLPGCWSCARATGASAPKKGITKGMMPSASAPVTSASASAAEVIGRLVILPSVASRNCKQPGRSEADRLVGREMLAQQRRDPPGGMGAVERLDGGFELGKPPVRHDRYHVLGAVGIAHLERQLQGRRIDDRPVPVDWIEKLHGSVACNVEQDDGLALHAFGSERDQLAMLVMLVVRLDLDPLRTPFAYLGDGVERGRAVDHARDLARADLVGDHVAGAADDVAARHIPHEVGLLVGADKLDLGGVWLDARERARRAVHEGDADRGNLLVGGRLRLPPRIRSWARDGAAKHHAVDQVDPAHRLGHDHLAVLGILLHH